MKKSEEILKDILREDYINLATAKLAREAGFDAWCRSSYVEYLVTQEHENPSFRMTKGDIEVLHDNHSNRIDRDTKSYKVYARPTQALLVKWLATKNIDVYTSAYREASPIIEGEHRKTYSCRVDNWNTIWSTHDGTGLQMPEHYHFEDKDRAIAREAGLQKALKILIDANS